MPVIIRGLSGLSKKIKDATATPADIISGKVAYGNDHTRMIGTHICKKKSVKLTFDVGESVNAYQVDGFSRHNRIGTAYSKVDEVLEMQTDPNYIYCLTDSISSLNLAYELSSSGYLYPFKTINTDIPWNENLTVSFIWGTYTGKMGVLGSKNLKNGWYASPLGRNGAGYQDPIKVKCEFYESNSELYKELYFAMYVVDNKIKQIGFATEVSSGNKYNVVNTFHVNLGFELSWI